MMFCNKHNCLTIYFLLLFVFAGCNIDKTPLNTDTGIDPEIIGDWYYKTTGTIAGDIYADAIHGIRILEDGVILRLAVELPTGKLTLLSGASPGTFLFAQNGRFSLRINQLGFAFVPRTPFNSTYEVNSQELIFKTMTDNGPISILNKEYAKSKIGNIVTDTVQTRLEMMMGDEPFTNPQVSSIPSAYAGYFDNDTTFIMHALSQRRYVIAFRLEDFSGIGLYELGSETSGTAIIYISSGDVIWIVSTDQHPFAGNINIESFDLVNKRCNGTFEFEIDSIQYSNGIFNVPVYEAD